VAGASTSVGSEDPSFARRAGEAIRFHDLTPCQGPTRSAAVARRCEGARIGVGSFGEHPSFGVGAARMRAVRPCQVTEVASFDGGGKSL
jgi:hypothetical protein